MRRLLRDAVAPGFTNSHLVSYDNRWKFFAKDPDDQVSPIGMAEHSNLTDLNIKWCVVPLQLKCLKSRIATVVESVAHEWVGDLFMTLSTPASYVARTPSTTWSNCSARPGTGGLSRGMDAVELSRDSGARRGSPILQSYDESLDMAAKDSAAIGREHREVLIRQGSSIKESGRVFGQAREAAKTTRIALYVRITLRSNAYLRFVWFCCRIQQI